METRSLQPPWYQKVFHPAVISAARIVLVPYVILTLSKNMNRAAAMLAFVAIVSDILDGFLARLWRLESDIGAFLDQLADKVFYAPLFFFFFAWSFVSGEAPPIAFQIAVFEEWGYLPHVALIMAIDFVLFLTRTRALDGYLKVATNQAKWPGKVKTWMFGIMSLLFICGTMYGSAFMIIAGEIVLYLGIGFAVASLFCRVHVRRLAEDVLMI